MSLHQDEASQVMYSSATQLVNPHMQCAGSSDVGRVLGATHAPSLRMKKAWLLSSAKLE